MSYNTILVETRNSVAIVTLNRPKAMNALSSELTGEMSDALRALDRDDAVRCIVITGSDKAFAAGADIKEMQDKDFVEVFREDFITETWEQLASTRKPVIAAVAGYALGGGCELAMMCDMIIAAENAKFGQPEITLGIIPGAGGTQRLTRAIGKAKAMDMILTGRMMDAAEAEKNGLVARIVPVNDLLAETMKIAERIAHMSLPITMMAKECINRAFETGLKDGVQYERRQFYACFATDDQKEGMSAFTEKRQPDFNDS